MVFSLNPLFILIRSVAFLPVVVVKIPNSNRIDFKLSKGMILNSFFQGILVLYSVYAQTIRINDDVEHRTIPYTPTVAITSACNFYVLHTLPILCILQVGKKMKGFKEISDLALFLHRENSSTKKRFISYFTLAYVCYSLASFAYCLRAEYVMKITYFVEYLKFIFTCTVVEFFEVVSDVKDCFYQLNDILPETFERCSAKERMLSTVPCVKVSPVSQMANLDLRNIFELHRQLCCVVEEINAVYGCQNLLVVVCIFLQLIYCPLELLSLPALYHTWPVILHGINGILMYLMLLYILVRPCSHAAAEAKRTVAILSKLMEKSLHEDFFKELEMYCHQLFLRKVEFSACGFFTLEIPLILSMLSIVTTYFTIIIQFQITDTKKETETTVATLAYLNFTLKP